MKIYSRIFVGAAWRRLKWGLVKYKLDSNGRPYIISDGRPLLYLGGVKTPYWGEVPVELILATDVAYIGRKFFPTTRGEPFRLPRPDTAPKGAIIAGAMIHDGIGVISRDLIKGHEVAWENIGRPKGQYMLVQQLHEFGFPIQVNKIEVEAMINSAYDLVDEWLPDLPASLTMHPRVGVHMKKAYRQVIWEALTSVRFDGLQGRAVPKTDDGGQEALVYRNPIDSRASIRVAPLIRGHHDLVQYTWTGVDGHAFFKGMLQVVEQPGIFVVCEDDYKMPGDEKEGWMALIMATPANQTLQIDPALWKTMGGDFDGDYLVAITDSRVAPGSTGQIAYDLVKDLALDRVRKVEDKTEKVVKNRPRMEETSWADIMAWINQARRGMIGIATNAMTSFLAIPPEKRDEIARSYGFRDASAFLAGVSEQIKLATDQPKSMHKVNIGWCASFLSKNRAFFLEEKDAVLKRGEVNPAPDDATGIVATIWREVSPIIDKCPPVASMPLESFRDYAIDPGPRYTEIAKKVRDRFFELMAAHDENGQPIYSLGDADDRQALQDECLRDIPSDERWLVANALWRIDHDARSEKAHAGVVFTLFPYECERIGEEMPGLADQTVRLIGLKYQHPSLTEWEGEVEVKVITWDLQQRPAVNLPLPKSKDGRLTALGASALLATYIEPGRYKVSIRGNAMTIIEKLS